MSKLIEFLKDAVGSYAEARGQSSDRVWLGTYLRQKLPDWSAEMVDKAADEITDTLALHDRKLQALKAAKSVGVSAEEWLSADVQECTDDQKREIIKRTWSAVQKQTGYADAEMTEVAESADETAGSGLKNAFRKLAGAVANTALSWIASNEHTEVLEDEIEEDEEQADAQPQKKGFFRQLLEEGAIAGLKVAVSAGLTVAEAGEKSESTPVRMLATVAHKVIEEAHVLYGVIRGTTKLRDAVTHIKDTAVAAVAGVIEQERSGELGRRMASAVGRSVGKAVGLVFGPVGAKVGAAVGSFLAQEVTGETVVKAAKAVAGAAKSIISTGAEIIKVVGATIKNGIRNGLARIFG